MCKKEQHILSKKQQLKENQTFLGVGGGQHG